MATLTPKRITLKEFLELPEGPPNYEFEEGIPVPVTSPRPKHQETLAVLFVMVRQFVKKNRMGRAIMEVDVFLPDGRVLIPDMSFVSAERVGIFDPLSDKIHGVPDLVVEIISENAARDRVHKFQIYYENGIQWYWIVDPETLAIEEYHQTQEGYVRTSSVMENEIFQPGIFPNLEINLSDLMGDNE